MKKIAPLGYKESNERTVSKHRVPKNFVPFKERMQMGEKEPPFRINQGGSTKRKIKITLPKIKI